MRAKGYYYMENGQAYMVAESVAKDINKSIAHGLPVDTGGRVIYPIISDPTEREIRAGKAKTAAWVIRPNSSPTLRWYWQIQEHKKSHASCKPIGDGLCGFKMVRFFTWNASAGKWELSPMVNHATPEQEQVLDSN